MHVPTDGDTLGAPTTNQREEREVSKLADRIRKAARIESQSIGFMAARAEKQATMLLGGLARDARAAAELARRGADFVIVQKAAPGDGKECGDAIAGALIEGDADATAYKDGGFDFVIFDPDRTSSTAVLEENVGYVMIAPRDASDTDLRAIEAFQLDAVDVGELKGPLTVRRQMELRRIFGLTRKPLFATVAADISVAALQALRDTNVAAVMADSGDHVDRLRKTIDALPPRTRRRDDDRPTPLVPRAAPGAGEDEHDHDHDDE
jgi:hypothetical protein